MEIPDVTGFKLGEAKEKLIAAGISICTVTVTAPPRCKISGYDDHFRVLRCAFVDEKKAELLVCDPNAV